MTVTATVRSLHAPQTISIAPRRLQPNRFSLAIYGDPAAEINDLITSIRDHGVLVPLVVVPGPRSGNWEVVSGHRRLACALALGLTEVPCEVRALTAGIARRRAILEYNRQRSKNFSQLMREADALEVPFTRDVGNIPRIRGRDDHPSSVFVHNAVCVTLALPVESDGDDTIEAARQPLNTALVQRADNQRTTSVGPIDDFSQRSSVRGIRSAEAQVDDRRISRTCLVYSPHEH